MWRGSSKKKKRVRLTEVSRGSGKPVLFQNVNINQAAKKLYDYEETGLAPYEVRVLMEREKALTEQVKKIEERKTEIFHELQGLCAEKGNGHKWCSITKLTEALMKKADNNT